MKRLGVVVSKHKIIRKSVSEWAEEIAKAGTHKYVKREGSPGSYTYYYRLPDGSVGTKEDLEAGKKGKTPPSPQVGRGKAPEQSQSPKGKDAGAAPKPKAAGGGKGPNVAQGDNVTGKDAYTGQEVSGVVTAKGKDGVTVTNDQGIQHHIRNDGILKNNKAGKGDKSWVDPSSFKASDWAKQWIDPNATPNDAGVACVINNLGTDDAAEIADKVREINEKLKGRPQTIHEYRISGEGESAMYSPKRKKLHQKIMTKLLRPNKLKSARPQNGEKPTFMILGGRGGSGKSWFENNAYDPEKYIILDADEIKKEIPEYKGWNAYDVHEESSDILELMLAKCIKRGLNVVLDGTMKTATSAIAKTLRTKAAGYRTEAHYMHLPPQEAAKRAIFRYKDGGTKDKETGTVVPFTGRYVPPAVVLQNTGNEDSFDRVKDFVDKWSFRDSQDGFPPKLISAGEKSVKKSVLGLVISYR